MPIRVSLADKRCKVCNLLWCKNFQYRPDGTRRHNGFFHRCGASRDGRFDGNGPFMRVGLDMKPNGWTDRTGCEIDEKPAENGLIRENKIPAEKRLSAAS